MPENWNYNVTKHIGPNLEKRSMPVYDEKPGHMAEKIIRDSISSDRNSAVSFVEKVEQATPDEDQKEKVDFWLKFAGIEEPLGIQFTTDSNKVEEKERDLARKSFVVTKEKRDDAEIGWSGRANVVVVQGDWEKMTRSMNQKAGQGKSADGIVDNSFVKGFFRQVLEGLGRINPIRKKIILEAMQNSQRASMGRPEIKHIPRRDSSAVQRTL